MSQSTSQSNGSRGVLVNKEDLGKRFAHLKNQLPKMPSLDLRQDFGGIHEEVKLKLANIEIIQADIADVVKWLQLTKKELAAYEGRAKKIAFAAVSAELQEAEKRISDYFGLEDQIYKTAARMAYVQNVMAGEYGTPDEAREALVDLENRELLKQAVNGNIRIGYQNFSINFELDDDERKELEQPIVQFSRLILTVTRQGRQVAKKAMAEEADMSVKDFLDGKKGLCLMEVPPEHFEGSDGQPKWRGGGSMLVESDGRMVFPVQGVGAIEKATQTMKENGICLPLYMITEWKNAPVFYKLEQTAKGRGLDDDAAKQTARSQQAFWHLLDRALAAHNQEEKLAELKAEFQGQADVTAQEFYALQGADCKDGTAFLEFTGAFRVENNQSIYGVFLLIRIEGEYIEIVEYSPGLHTELGKYAGERWLKEDNFRKCPLFVGKLLRAIRGQVDMAQVTATTVA